VSHPLKPLFDPETVAVIGASSDSNKFGGRPIKYMGQAGFKGRIYPINPKAGEILGHRAYADIREVPERIDLAIVSVPAPLVTGAVEACVEAGVRTACIFSSGFAEVGGEGVLWQQRLQEIAHTGPTRLVGPNCMGMLNVETGAVGTFSGAFEHGWPKPGGVLVASQSGAVGSHSLVLLRERGLGVRGWVTTGNEVDVDVADCIAFAAEDPKTKVIVAYLEGCKDAARLLAALAAARAARKPVIVMKVGASEVGAAAAGTHTASLAGADAVFDAVFRQYGAFRVHTLEEMTDVAAACLAEAYPAGRRLGIVTVSGGVGVLSCDTAARYGLEVPELPADAQAKLKALMPFATVRNPLDTTAQLLTNNQLLKPNLETLLERGGCDAVLVFLTSAGLSRSMMPNFKKTMLEVRRSFPGSLIALSMLTYPEDRAELEAARFLVFEDPSRAIAAIAALMSFGRAFAAPPAEPPPDLPAGARPAPAEATSEHEAARLLRSAGLPVAENRLAATAEEAAAAADALGYPVVLKVSSATIQHKSDVGGVRLGLKDQAAVRAAFDAIVRSVAEKAPGQPVDGVLVAPMLSGGVETLMGTVNDPVFGPVVVFGLGGILVEVLHDVAMRIAPFGTDEAHRMLREIKGFKVLEGVRGQPPADLDALARTLAQLSAYAAQERDRIASIDLNPVLARPDGCIALDALVAPVGRAGGGH